MLTLQKFSLGVGDRFAHQAKAQLEACRMAAARGVDVAPVWNKSNREHLIVGSEPGSVREAADAAVRQLGWTTPYHVDADHINLGTVDRFIDASDFYTLDVASAIGEPPAGADVDAFVAGHPELSKDSGKDAVAATARKYLYAVQQAGAIYRHIAEKREGLPFITEISMDETDSPQTPPELLVILAAIAQEGIPIQTIAPKFTGRFNKGVDYVGDVAQFEREFTDDLGVIAHAIRQYGLPANLKLSVHSGSDKFSIYASIRRALRKTGAGVHVKTAGTTWLEELIGLAEAGGEGLAMAKYVYGKAYADREALCAPYASVIDIDDAKLPAPSAVEGWTAEQYTSALRHDPRNTGFNPDVRQLLHVGYKVAAKMGEKYLKMLQACEASISRNVTDNLFDRHIRPIFLED
jgi:hypothetical protein